MEWLKKLIEGAKKKDDGSIDIHDLMKSINTEFPKNAVPKTTYNDVSEQLKTAQTTIKERDTQIEGLKKVDGEALQAEITKLQNENKEAATKHQQELKDLQISNAIKLAIVDKAQDADLVSGLFDKSKLILGDDGKITTGYSLQHVFRIHNKFLKCIEIPKGESKCCRLIYYKT